MVGALVALVLVLFAIFVAAKTVRIIPQAKAGVVERLGRYSRTLTPGMTIVVPFIDRVRPLLDLREQVVTFPPQPVITADNVSVGIDTVLYFTITELKAIDPPSTIQEAMEKQMRAERDRRAAILNAEGVKQSQILTAEGEKQSAVLKAEGAKQAAILRAEGEAKAIDTVFSAIHAGDPDPKLLSYQYLQMLPQLARGEANKIWVIPSEFTQALSNLGGLASGGQDRRGGPAPAPDPTEPPALPPPARGG